MYTQNGKNIERLNLPKSQNKTDTDLLCFTLQGRHPFYVWFFASLVKFNLGIPSVSSAGIYFYLYYQCITLSTFPGRRCRDPVKIHLRVCFPWEHGSSIQIGGTGGSSYWYPTEINSWESEQTLILETWLLKCFPPLARNIQEIFFECLLCARHHSGHCSRHWVYGSEQNKQPCPQGAFMLWGERDGAP